MRPRRVLDWMGRGTGALWTSKGQKRAGSRRHDPSEATRRFTPAWTVDARGGTIGAVRSSFILYSRVSSRLPPRARTLLQRVSRLEQHLKYVRAIIPTFNPQDFARNLIEAGRSGYSRARNFLTIVVASAATISDAWVKRPQVLRKCFSPGTRDLLLLLSGIIH